MKVKLNINVLLFVVVVSVLIKDRIIKNKIF